MRRLPSFIVAVVLTAMALPAVAADPFPSKQIRVINPWPPGGPADLIARPVTDGLRERLGQPAFMDNRAGANGTMGAGLAANSPADGHTILLAHVGPTVISPAMGQQLPYDSEKDFEPITQAISGPLVFLVRPSLPYKTMADVIAAAKAAPGKLTYGSVGIGSTAHLAGEIMKLGAGIDLLHVPFRGSTPAINELLADRIDFVYVNVAAAIGFVRQGQMRPIAVTTKTRSSVLPEIPTMDSVIPGFEVNSWYGFLAPKGTPPEVVARLNKEIIAIMTSPDVSERMKGAGFDVTTSTPAEFRKKITDDMKYWKDVVARTGIKAE